MKKTLIVLTSHGELGTTGRPTGWYLPEVSHPHRVLTARGIEVDFVSPQGGKPPMDPNSRNLDDPDNRAFLENPEWMHKVENTLSPDHVKPNDYGAILYAGGHGTMWDFPGNEQLAHVAAEIYENGGVVAAVCHGPAGLVNVHLSNGDYLVAGKTAAAFTNDEEAAAGLTEVVPFLLESKLIDRGARHTKAANFQSHVVVSERLVTRQNPASAQGVGKAMAELL